MAWHASNKDAIARVMRRMVVCANCDYCKSMPRKPGEMRQNNCKKQPLQVFFTDVDRICRYHSRIEWLESKGFKFGQL